MNTLTIVVKKPGEPAYKAEMENTLKAMQAIVGGYIERVPGDATGLPHGVDIYANEESKIRPGFEPNVWLFDHQDQIWGTFFIVGGDDSNGENVSLTEDQVSDALSWCGKYSGPSPERVRQIATLVRDQIIYALECELEGGEAIMKEAWEACRTHEEQTVAELELSKIIDMI